MSIVSQIKPLVIKTLEELYGQAFNETAITISSTKPEFEGDYTLVLFSFVKQLKKSPEQLGTEIGEALIQSDPGLLSGLPTIFGQLYCNLTMPIQNLVSNLLTDKK